MRHIIASTFATALLGFALLQPADAASDPRITYLEQEIRELRRQVLSLTQRLDQATTRPSRPGGVPAGDAFQLRPTPDTSLRWLDADKWRSLKLGMSELEVIETLGKPNATRAEDGTRVVLYAMEIGESGFLGGSVRFREGKAAEIKQPSLQ